MDYCVLFAPLESMVETRIRIKSHSLRTAYTSKRGHGREEHKGVQEPGRLAGEQLFPRLGRGPGVRTVEPSGASGFTACPHERDVHTGLDLLQISAPSAARKRTNVSVCGGFVLSLTEVGRKKIRLRTGGNLEGS